jgi:NADH:ubiquinone oxidoreductase subunit K
MKSFINNFKRDIKELKDILLAAMSFKWISVIASVLFFLGIIAKYKDANFIIGAFEIMGAAFLIALLAISKKYFEKPEHIIYKAFLFSIMWLASCLAFVDFNEFSFELFMKIATAFEYILLGCLLPEVVARLDEVREKNIIDNDSLKDVIEKG